MQHEEQREAGAAAENRMRAPGMKGRELQALRKLLHLDVREAAEHVASVSARSWQYWESGKYPIPDDVSESMWRLVKRYGDLRAELEAQALTRTGIERPYCISFSEYVESNPAKTVLDWRLEQAVVANAYMLGHVTIG